jgi:hypothetical protein
MASFECLAATGESIVRLLNTSFEEESPIAGASPRPRAVLIRTEDMENIGQEGSAIRPPALSVFFYRVDYNHATRAGWSSVGSQNGRAHLPLDLHFLITAWAGNAEHELLILGRAMQCLESTPSLAGPLLARGAGSAPNDSIQILMEEISTEAVMRTYDSLPHDYKLSVPYVARVVRLDSLRATPPPEAITRVLGITSPGEK